MSDRAAQSVSTREFVLVSYTHTYKELVLTSYSLHVAACSARACLALGTFVCVMCEVQARVKTVYSCTAAHWGLRCGTPIATLIGAGHQRSYPQGAVGWGG